MKKKEKTYLVLVAFQLFLPRRQTPTTRRFQSPFLRQLLRPNFLRLPRRRPTTGIKNKKQSCVSAMIPFVSTIATSTLTSSPCSASPYLPQPTATCLPPRMYCPAATVSHFFLSGFLTALAFPFLGGFVTLVLSKWKNGKIKKHHK